MLTKELSIAGKKRKSTEIRLAKYLYIEFFLKETLMKKILLSSICLLNCCVTDASNINERLKDWRVAHGLMVANAEDCISAEYKEVCKQYHEKGREAQESLSRLKTDIYATGDDSLISATSSQFLLIPSNEDFLGLLERLSGSKFSKKKIQEEDRILEYESRFDEIFDKDPRWVFLKENKILSTINCRYTYKGKLLGIKELVEGNSAAEILLNVMLREMDIWREDLLEEVSKQIHPDNEKVWQAAKYGYLVSGVPFSNARASFPSSFPEELSRAFERHNLKEQSEKYAEISLDCYRWNMHRLFLEHKYSISEEKKEAKERVQEYISEEIQLSSRELTEQEKKDIAGLQNIARKHGIQTFRIIDAETLINAYNIHPAEKAHLLELLKYGALQDVYKEIVQFVEESVFDERSFEEELKSDPATTLLPQLQLEGKKHSRTTFKQIVLEALLNAAGRSLIHRAQIITLIAWSKAFAPMISDVESYSYGECLHPYLQKYSIINIRRPLHFICKKKCISAAYDTITLDLFNTGRGALYGLSSDFSDSPILYQKAITKLLFHEISHIISANIVQASSYSTLSTLGSKSMAVASEGFVLSMNKQAIEHNIEKIKTLSNEASETLMHKFHMGCFADSYDPSIDQPIDVLKQLQCSNAVYTSVNEFQRPVELMQILGLFENDNILYINKLSDFVASAFEGLPLRVNHRMTVKGEKITPINALFDNIKEIVQFTPYIKSMRLNPIFFKSLLFANGISPSFYRELVHINDLYANMWIIPTKSLSHALKYMNRMTHSEEFSMQNYPTKEVREEKYLRY